jgi:ribonuclease P protein component
MPGPDGQIRVGYVAGKRVGKAVVRNRAKRRLREAVRRIALEPGYDYVLIADASVATAAFATLVSWVDEGVGGG